MSKLPDHATDHLESLLRSRGLNLTVQRRVILQAIVGRRDHPTAEQIYESIRLRLPGLSKATVYRVLDTLVQVGAVRRVFHTDSAVRFDPQTKRHHHLACVMCGSVSDIEEDEAIADIRLPDTTGSGFTVTDYVINFTGICSGCQNRKT